MAIGGGVQGGANITLTVSRYVKAEFSVVIVERGGQDGGQGA